MAAEHLDPDGEKFDYIILSDLAFFLLAGGTGRKRAAQTPLDLESLS